MSARAVLARVTAEALRPAPAETPAPARLPAGAPAAEAAGAAASAGFVRRVLSDGQRAVVEALAHHAASGTPLPSMAEFGRPLGLNVNQVVGHLGRLKASGVIVRVETGWLVPGHGVARLSNPARTPKRAEPAPAPVRVPPRPAPATAVAPLLLRPGSAGAALAALAADACRFPHGDPREAGFHFCGAPVMAEGAVYCAEHHRLTHRVPVAAAEGDT